jgi:hypothetical protein
MSFLTGMEGSKKSVQANQKRRFRNACPVETAFASFAVFNSGVGISSDLSFGAVS